MPGSRFISSLHQDWPGDVQALASHLSPETIDGVTIDRDDHGYVEIFTAGGSILLSAAQAEALGRTLLTGDV